MPFWILSPIRRLGNGCDPPTAPTALAQVHPLTTSNISSRRMQSPTPSEKLQLGCHVRLKIQRVELNLKHKRVYMWVCSFSAQRPSILAACEQTKWKKNDMTWLDCYMTEWALTSGETTWTHDGVLCKVTTAAEWTQGEFYKWIKRPDMILVSSRWVRVEICVSELNLFWWPQDKLLKMTESDTQSESDDSRDTLSSVARSK